MEQHTQMRVGMVGCGYQGGILAQTIRRGNQFQVVACADPDQSAALRVANIGGNAVVFASVEEMLAQTELDAVMIATSHNALCECALAAIRAGKPVLVEKPLGINEHQAALLEEAVTRAQMIFMAGYSFRYIASWKKVRELLQAGAVGQIQHIAGSIGTTPMLKGWKSSPTTGGGPMLFVGSHLIDEILWYLEDDPVEVSACIRWRADTQADETTLFQIQFARGATAQGMITQTASGFFNHLDIFGNQGRISLRGAGFDFVVEVVSNALPGFAQLTTIHSPQIEDARILKHLAQLDEFAHAIREHHAPSCTLSQGRRVLQVIDAFHASALTGCAVPINSKRD